MKKSTDLRVISGTLRGRILKSPNSAFTHPMGAREKLALFNMVPVAGMKVLDTFAGSGALGIEALSRGAAEVVFVENNRKVAMTLRENLQDLGVFGGKSAVSGDVSADFSAKEANFQEKAQVFVEKVASFAENPEFLGYFEVIIADPPYDKLDIEELGKLEKLLAPGGILVLSSPKEVGEISLPRLRLSSRHTYARAQIAIYRKESV